MNDAAQTEALNRIEAWFSELEGSLTAFSGGVDSALVLYLSQLFLGKNGIGVVADSPSLKRSDLQIAKDFCKQCDITLRILKPTSWTTQTTRRIRSIAATSAKTRSTEG